jgi:hypothetical protein
LPTQSSDKILTPSSSPLQIPFAFIQFPIYEFLKVWGFRCIAIAHWQSRRAHWQSLMLVFANSTRRQQLKAKHLQIPM